MFLHHGQGDRSNPGKVRLGVRGSGAPTDPSFTQGLVSGVERFAIHDGPGIRTLVFMKGCPLRCSWCSSPETQNQFVEILHDLSRCRACGRCVEVCTPRAVALLDDGRMQIDRTLCTNCAACVEACPNQAYAFVGRWVTVAELLAEVTRDSTYFRRSTGGVTVGGGEPALQHEFVAAFLAELRRLHVHTAIETSGYVDWRRLRRLLDFLDLVYLDIKHMNRAQHERVTGVSNEPILENARLVSQSHPLILRLPIVPGINDADENIATAARFASEPGPNLLRVELLPYHKLGVPTYRRLGRAYALEALDAPTRSTMLRLQNIVAASGVQAQIGG